MRDLILKFIEVVRVGGRSISANNDVSFLLDNYHGRERVFNVRHDGKFISARDVNLGQRLFTNQFQQNRRHVHGFGVLQFHGHAFHGYDVYYFFITK